MGSVGTAGSAIKKVLVLANNRIATSINKALVADGIKVHQAVYRQETGSSIDGVNLHTSDFSSSSLSTILRELSPDLVISTTRGGDHELQRRIVDCTLDAGVRRFIPAEFGHDSLNHKLRQGLPPLVQRAKTIDYLRQLSDAGRLEWVAFATGTLLDHGLQSGNLGFDLKWQSATLHGTGDERFTASSTLWIGRVVVASIHHWEAVRNRYLYSAGLIISANEIFRSLEQSTGKQWEVGRGEVEDCVGEAKRRIKMGFPDAGMFLMERSVLYDETLGAVHPFIEFDAKPELGLIGEVLADVVHAATHQHSDHTKGGCGCD